MTHNSSKFAILLLILLLVSCSGLAGEPEIVSTLIPPTAVPTESAHPLAIPDAARGAVVYAENCVRCHGASGAGDGEFVLTGQVTNVASFLDPATAAGQQPADWFQTITEGRIENLMPPWRDALSHEDRWAVAMYTYTLHNTPEILARGRELYDSSCLECHGESGRGDGVRVAELNDSPGDLSDWVGMSYLSDQAMAVSVREGIGDTMPAHGIEFGGEWSEDDIRAAVGYVRTLSLANAQAVGVSAPAIAQIVTTEEVGVDTPSAESTAESVTIPDVVRVTGIITNGTASGSFPAGLPVSLFAFDSQFNQTQYDSVSDESGAFAFEDIPYISDSAYIMTVNYRERVFTSDLLRGTALAEAASSGVLNLPVTIYELTDDPNVISISGMVAQVSVVGDGMEVAQVFSIRNESDRAFTSAQLTEDGRPISLIIPLPPGALIASLMGGDQRYVVPEDNSAILDTAMVLPGDDHIVNVIYLVQYGSGAIIEQEINYPFLGTARLLVRPLDIAVNSSQMPPLGEETIGSSTFAAYGSEVSLNAGDVIRYELSGASADAGTVDRGSGAVVTANNLPLIAGFVLIIVGLIVGAFYVIGVRNQAANRGGAAPENKIDALASAIADLDAEFAAGRINEADYQTQRAALKARLARLMKNAEK